MQSLKEAVEVTARKLALSKRTLLRRLNVEGTSYQQLLSKTRAALAWHYLEQTALPTPKTAFLLGVEQT